MEKRDDLILEITLVIAMIALTGLSVYAAQDPAPAREVLLTGRLHVEDRQVDDLVLVVELDHDRCNYAEVLDNGRFIIQVPVGAEVLLSFIKPGHLSKEVMVDTRNAMRTRKAWRENHIVKFDVELEPMEKRPGRKYQGPVGSLSFVNGTGTMRVKHEPHLVNIEPGSR